MPSVSGGDFALGAMYGHGRTWASFYALGVGRGFAPRSGKGTGRAQ